MTPTNNEEVLTIQINYYTVEIKYGCDNSNGNSIDKDNSAITNKVDDKVILYRSLKFSGLWKPPEQFNSIKINGKYKWLVPDQDFHFFFVRSHLTSTSICESVFVIHFLSNIKNK